MEGLKELTETGNHEFSLPVSLGFCVSPSLFTSRDDLCLLIGLPPSWHCFLVNPVGRNFIWSGVELKS